MNSCTPTRKYAKSSLGACEPRKRSFKNFDEVAQDYIDSRREKVRTELNYFGGQPNLQEAIRVAALAINKKGKRHDHQRRIPRAMLECFRRGLSRKRETLRACKTFHELMEIAEKVAAGIWKNSRLTVYDTAHRVGAHLGLEPDRVYLHAGTKEGARAFGFSASLAFIFPRELPKSFRRLAPYEIEDCLCWRKDELKLLATRGRCSYK